LWYTPFVSVEMLNEQRSHWVATAPAGLTVAWDAELTADRPNEFIAWRSLPNADIPDTVQVQFQSAPGKRGTEVHEVFEYSPPGGSAGAGVAKLWGEEPAQQVKADLRRLKQMFEAGEIPTTNGQAPAHA
jgi:uncharacterized membrane protein